MPLLNMNAKSWFLIYQNYSDFEINTSDGGGDERCD